MRVPLRNKFIGNNQFKSTIYCLSTLIILISLIQVNEGQFFTKSSSKSIPRMGRRSVGNESPLLDEHLNAYRRSVINGLVDEYGPKWMESVERAKDGFDGEHENTKNNKQAGGEIAIINDQPFDENPSSNGGMDEDFVLVARGGRGQRQVRSNSHEDLSLAMRALNIKRYMEQLASGQPPTGLFVPSKVPELRRKSLIKSGGSEEEKQRAKYQAD